MESTTYAEAVEAGTFNPLDLMSDVITWGKYASHLEEHKRRETWIETTTRNMEMHQRKYPAIANEIAEVYARSVFNYHVVPSMRSLQFGGKAIESNNVRMFNCSGLSLSDPESFGELMYLLLAGTGAGPSVQRFHIDMLPAITTPTRKHLPHEVFSISDDIPGWADAVIALLNSYFVEDHHYVDFDYSLIRAKGTPLKTSGGKAPGPGPLRICLENIREVLDSVVEEQGENTKIRPIHAYDIACYIAESVKAGGIRRSAMIALFSDDDEEMATSKGYFECELNSMTPKDDTPETDLSKMYDVEIFYKGKYINTTMSQWEVNEYDRVGKLSFWTLEPQRKMSNNSVVFHREHTTKDQFLHMMRAARDSNAGEPGVYFTNDYNLLTNPCVEISLRDRGFCNLTEVNVDGVKNQADLNQRVADAVFLGTLQAGYTDFPYLRKEWKINAEEEALLGVSMTGIGSGHVENLDINEAAKVALGENERVAELIGINIARRIGCIKPSGTASLVLKTSSGIHAWYDKQYIRRFEADKDEPLYIYAKEILGDEFVESCVSGKKNKGFIALPVKAPDTAMIRTETEIETLERVRRFQLEWIRGTHREGVNNHNVSVTINVRPDNWESTFEWMWENREIYNGISLIPYDNGVYKQPPFESITPERYEELRKILEERVVNFDTRNIIEEVNTISFEQESACSGGACELTRI